MLFRSVIVAGLVLIMMIIWFGESPTLFQDHVFMKARFVEAPGVNVGIPVRKSGIRIGEVSAIEFDETPGKPDGVIVTLSLERKFPLKQGSIPRISRALIGDVSIDMTPGQGPAFIILGNSAATAPPTVEGEVAPDPAKALAAATEAFEKVGGTLTAIETAAKGVSSLAKKAETLDTFLDTIRDAGKNLSGAAKRIDDVIAANQDSLGKTVADLRDVSKKLNGTLDEATLANAKKSLDRLSTVTAKLDQALNDVRPLLTDLGANVALTPTTNFGQAVYRLNRISSDLGLLTRNLSDSKGNFNTNGSLQRLVSDPALFDNLSRMAGAANEVFNGLKPAVASLRLFAEKVARDPSSLTKGALQR